MAQMPEPRYVGGQAVMEGVMMRGATTWAVSVRTREGGIRTEVNEAPSWARKWAKVPLARGVATLVESMAIGSHKTLRLAYTPSPSVRNASLSSTITHSAGGPAGSNRWASDKYPT